MRKTFYLIISLFILAVAVSCKDSKPKAVTAQTDGETDTLAAGDSTVYGTMIDGGMNSLVLLTDNGDRFMRSAINLTSLLGHWTSLDRNFEIKEGGTVTSSLQSEKNPWTSWKIWNGKLILSKDTFDVDNLGADSLSLENKDGIFIYTREK